VADLHVQIDATREETKTSVQKELDQVSKAVVCGVASVVFHFFH
jgi:hypothetical protein